MVVVIIRATSGGRAGWRHTGVNAGAVTRPMLREPPVTSAIFPASSCWSLMLPKHVAAGSLRDQGLTHAYRPNTR
jgi:hypothetical protein